MRKINVPTVQKEGLETEESDSGGRRTPPDGGEEEES